MSNCLSEERLDQAVSQILERAFAGDNQPWGFFLEEVQQGTPGALPVKSVLGLEEEFNLKDGFDFFKIDIENAEWSVFAEDSDTRWVNKAELLVMELHRRPNHPNEIGDLIKNMKARGFQEKYIGEYVVFAKDNIFKKLTW